MLANQENNQAGNYGTYRKLNQKDQGFNKKEKVTEKRMEIKRDHM